MEMGATVETQSTLDDLKKAAGAAFRAADYETALANYTRALDIAPGTRELLSNRAACSAAAKDYRRSLSDADECIRVAPDWGKGWLRKGAALHGLGLFAEAIAAYQQGVAADPSMEGALKVGLADVQLAQVRAGGDWCTVLEPQTTVARAIPMGEVSPVPQWSSSAGVLGPAPDGFCLADPGMRQVLLYDSTGSLQRTFNAERPEMGRPGQLVPGGTLNGPLGIACDAASLYVADSLRRSDEAHREEEEGEGEGEGEAGGVSRVLKLRVIDNRSVNDKAEQEKPSNEYSAPHHTLATRRATGLALLDDGATRAVFVTDTARHRLLGLETDLSLAFVFGKRGAANGELRSPEGVAVAAGLLAIADTGNRRVLVLGLTGSRLARDPRAGPAPEGGALYVEVAPADGPARFATPPRHVALLGGKLLVVEDRGQRVLVFALPSGAPLGTLVPPHRGELTGICRGGDGRLYVSSDSPSGHRILALPANALTDGALAANRAAWPGFHQVSV